MHVSGWLALHVGGLHSTFPRAEPVTTFDAELLLIVVVCPHTLQWRLLYPDRDAKSTSGNVLAGMPPSLSVRLRRGAACVRCERQLAHTCKLKANMGDVPLSEMFSEALQPSGAAALSLPSSQLAPLHTAAAAAPPPAPPPPTPDRPPPTPATFGAAEAAAWPPAAAPRTAPTAGPPVPVAREGRKGMPTWVLVAGIALVLAVAYIWVKRGTHSSKADEASAPERAALAPPIKSFRERRAAVQSYQAAATSAPSVPMPRPPAASARSVTVPSAIPRAAAAAPQETSKEEPDPLLRPIDLSALKE